MLTDYHQQAIQASHLPSVPLQLLLGCARTQISPATTASLLPLIQTLVDWEQLIQLASLHGVVPLLYQNLKTFYPEKIPPVVLEQLRHHAQSTALRNSIFTKELLQICELFSAQGIRVLPFKGPILAVLAYGNLSLRDFCDLDLWVHPQDSAAAISLLTQQAGFQLGRQWHFLDPVREQRYQQTWRECNLRKGSLAIDLHQYLTVEKFLSTSFTFDELWQRRTTIEISNHQLPSFCAVDTLLYLCIHGSKECWRGLKWICDVAECVRTYDWQWDEVLGLAQERGCQRRLVLGLALAHALLDSPFPTLAQQQWEADRVNQQLTQTTLTYLFRNDNPCGQKFSWPKFKRHVQSVERPQDQWRSLEELRRLVRSSTMRVFPNNEDLESFPLPHSLQWLYYVLRPLRLLGRQLSGEGHDSPS